MRTSVVSIVNYENLEIVEENSKNFCMVTHYDPRCVASCLCINIILSLLLQNLNFEKILEKAFNKVTEYLKNEKCDSDEFIRYFNTTSIQDLNLSEGSSIGYTYKCMACGVYAFREILKFHRENKNRNEFDYKALFDDITMECGDADTNLTTVGALCGCYIGYQNLDKNWLNLMPDKPFLDRNVQKFLKLMGYDETKVSNFLNYKFQ